MSTFEWDDSRVQALLSGIVERTQDASPALQAFGIAFRGIMAAQFESEGAALGSPWAPLVRPPADPARKILQDTLRLMLSFTSTTRGGNVTRVGPLEGDFGSSIRYARFHQAGTSRMVARPIVVAGGPVADAAVALVAAHVMGRPLAGGFLPTPGGPGPWDRASARGQPETHEGIFGTIAEAAYKPLEELGRQAVDPVTPEGDLRGSLE